MVIAQPCSKKKILRHAATAKDFLQRDMRDYASSAKYLMVRTIWLV